MPNLLQVIVCTERAPASMIGETATVSRDNETLTPTIVAAKPYTMPDDYDGPPAVMLDLDFPEPFSPAATRGWYVHVQEPADA